MKHYPKEEQMDMPFPYSIEEAKRELSELENIKFDEALLNPEFISQEVVDNVCNKLDERIEFLVHLNEGMERMISEEQEQS